MRNRGKVFWDWADPALHTRSVDERQPDGTLLNVQVRMSLLGRTELFIGVYGINGKMLFEEAPDSLPGETMTNALARGLDRARLNAPLATQSVMRGL
ncbi:hypothetical protein SAMN04490190_0537 [Pseudomonas libanensis]|uniref:Uncharacterized protein n=1 Tax=Pseudomonas libanensis TaxID=75588 RepID=A0A0R2Y0H2_9PSED|nr:hypothetical protein [Pseudomonas libanensis]KRP41800.1 hypothetical protein TU73_24910 [Pseudomonas libanensis]SDK57971.1 hypothetical protein SAMN04490190_0537 [Pseudomonas libanensis]